MKVYQLDDCDWWVGPSLAACIAEARAQCGAGSYCDAEEEGREVTAEQMQRLTYIDEEEDKPQTRTFAAQLARDIADGGQFPRFSASPER